MPEMGRAGPWPKDIKPCNKCEADIVFLRTRSKPRRWIPVNVVPTESEFRGPNAGETDYRHGVHQKHRDTCPCAGEFSGGRY